MSTPTTPSSRLQRALKLLELARTARDLPYAATPYVLASEYLIQKAIKECK